MQLHSINHEQGLYVMHEGDGFSCYGFDVLDRKARAVAAWRGAAGTITAAPGTAEHFAQCDAELSAGAAHATATRARCPAELTPELVALEGMRVEVTYPAAIGEKPRRFWVGKSTGWMPCHLEINSRRSRGGGSVYFPPGSTVRVVSTDRR